jgi:hypothetical protein
MKTTKHMSVRTTLHITAGEIRQFVGAPENAKVFFVVPSGGDYSGIDVDIDEKATGEQVVQVQWEIETRDE